MNTHVAVSLLALLSKSSQSTIDLHESDNIAACSKVQYFIMFNDAWECEFFCFLNAENRVQCFICQMQIARADKFNIRRHYMTRHIEFKNYKDEERIKILNDLRMKIPSFYLPRPNPPENTLTNPKIKASYVVALALAKQCRPYHDGMFVKNLCQDILKCFGQNGEDLAEVIESVPLSTETLTRRTEEISNFLSLDVKKCLKDCIYFSISLDESTDINNMSQLAIYVRTVHDNFEVHEDFFGLVSMRGHVNGQTLWEAVNEKVFHMLT